MSHPSEAMPRATFRNLPAAKRQRIVDAAVEEFGSRPYPKATLDRIVAAAGVSKGSMYQYFEGKADLYGWLLTEYTATKKLEALGPPAPEPGETLWAMLERTFAAGVRFAIAEPALTRLGARFRRERELEPELAAMARELQRQAHEYLCATVRVARDRGELRADLDPDLFATLIAHALGDGMLDVLEQRFGLDLDDPAAVRRLEDGETRALVAEMISLLRQGAQNPDHDGESP